ncbi:hypothetical protein A3731_17845 [Roseovarius sp. HI0049]|nr:hypothetical protein A3731_17845 [Roseovarius sp. HI0049]
MVYVIPLLCFVIPLIAGAVLLRAGRGVIVAVLVVVLAVLLAWAIWKGRQASGWDGIGYAIVAMLMCAPGILGLLVGSAVGWWQARRKGLRG